MNPVILYDNKLIGLTVQHYTAIASGYSLANGLDQRVNTKIKFASAGPNNYIYYYGTSRNLSWIGFAGHNFGTANVTVTIANTAGYELASKVCSNDDAFIINVPSLSAANGIVVGFANSYGNAAPYFGVVYAGPVITFEYPFEGNAAFIRESIAAEVNSSNTGNMLGVNVRYTPVDFTHTFTDITRTWYAANYDPFWRTHGKLCKPFFYCADYDNTPGEVAFVRFKESYVNDKPVSLLTLYNSLVLDCIGIR